MNKSIILFFVLALVAPSCKKNLPDVGGTSAQKMANEWWCQIFVGTADVGGGYHKLMTYNTAANADSLWIDDLKNLYEFKVKMKADYNGLTFTTTQAQNEYYNIKVDITGKILLNAAKSKSGNTTDSIYMQAKFTDDPSTTYIIRGHARTKFSEDEY